jgi:hypothetical protein
MNILLEFLEVLRTQSHELGVVPQVARVCARAGLFEIVFEGSENLDPVVLLILGVRVSETVAQRKLVQTLSSASDHEMICLPVSPAFPALLSLVYRRCHDKSYTEHPQQAATLDPMYRPEQLQPPPSAGMSRESTPTLLHQSRADS